MIWIERKYNETFHALLSRTGMKGMCTTMVARRFDGKEFTWPVNDELPLPSADVVALGFDMPMTATELLARQAPDPVNHPAHYTAGAVECIDAIEAALTPEEFRGYCKGNALKYVWREQHKGGAESLAKAQWYLNRLTGTKA